MAKDKKMVLRTYKDKFGIKHHVLEPKVTVREFIRYFWGATAMEHPRIYWGIYAVSKFCYMIVK